MSKVWQIILHLIPFFAALIVSEILATHGYILLLIMLLVLFGQILLGKDWSLEFKMAGAGIVWGFVLEWWSVNISHFHTFTHPDIVNIPAWLPVIWGFGFVMGKRIAAILYSNSPWHHPTLEK